MFMLTYLYIQTVYLFELYIYIYKFKYVYIYTYNIHLSVYSFPNPKPAVAQHWTKRVSLRGEEETGHLPQLASLPKEPVVSKSRTNKCRAPLRL